MSIDTNDADLPASVPMQDWPPGPAEAIELVTTTWGDRLVVYHPDEQRMGAEWLESDCYVDVRECN